MASRHGARYHARTFGFLLDELVRRMAGITMSEYWRAAFADPLDLDIWIGLPTRNRTRSHDYPAKAAVWPVLRNSIETWPHREPLPEKLSPLRADFMR